MQAILPVLATALKDPKTITNVIDTARGLLDTIIHTEKSVDATFTMGVSVSGNPSEEIKKMDDQLKIIIASTTRTLEKTNLKTATWQDITSIIEQNPTIEPLGEPVFRADKLTKEEKSWSITNKGPNEETVKEVHSWFNRLISDADVLSQTKIDIDMLAKIVAATGITIRSFVNYIGGKEYIEKTLIDVGIIRYPDLENPFFKIYRIQLKAWQNSTKIFGYNTNDTGIAGEFAMRKYKPRESILKGLKAETQKKAVEEAEILYSRE